MQRKCNLCNKDISSMLSTAKYCCRSHKEKHYRHLNRDKVSEWKRNFYIRNKKQILIKNLEKDKREQKELGHSKKYLREYAKRHINDLIKLKGKICYQCGTNKLLIIHHIKYTKNPEDWEFLCYRCHIREHEPTTLL